jgi:hypothetical protein
VLRVPVRYYRAPPAYFRGWRADAAPRWGQHWGHDWEHRHHGWDRWDRHAAPRPAPLPVYQRAYYGDRYPHAPEHQHSIRAEQYRYRPHEPVTRTHFEPRGTPNADHWRTEPARHEPPGHRAPPPQQKRDDDRGNHGGQHDNGRPHDDEGRGHGRGH